ncbi:TnpV protein [Lactonifactor longoviformis]|uniref:TnpV protein n=1 Tax=Lactonifactor longoviformis TaxID=341220 RepID=UPI000934E5C3|nr:TnpV protein [Lactonifactor longoviformis]POP33182.1 TnpV protein [Lactonifactor longoviformis]
MEHREYLKKINPVLFNELLLNGELWSYSTQLNEQADTRYKLIIRQMMDNEGVTEELKRKSQMEWVSAVNNIINRAEEIIKSELIYV